MNDVKSREALWRWDTVLYATAIWVPGHLFNWALEKLWIVLAISLLAIPVLRRTSGLGRGMEFRTTMTVLAAGYFASVAAVLGFLFSSLGGASFTLDDWLDLPLPMIQTALLSLLLVHSPSLRPASLMVVTRWSIVLIGLFHVIFLRGVGPVQVFDLIYATTKTERFNDVVRVSVPFANPNHLAFFLVFAVLLLAACAWGRRKLLDVGLALMAIVLLFSTGSRTGVVALAAGLVTLVLLRAIRAARRGSIATPLFSIAMLALAVLTGFALMGDLGGRFAVFDPTPSAGGILDRLLAERNVAGRLDQASRAMQGSTLELLIGSGAGSESGLAVVDNQFLRWFARSGVLGVTLFLVMFGSFLGFVFQRTSDLGRSLAISLCASSLIFLLTGSFITNVRLLAIAGLLVLLVASPEFEFVKPAPSRRSDHHAERGSSRQAVSASSGARA